MRLDYILEFKPLLAANMSSDGASASASASPSSPQPQPQPQSQCDSDGRDGDGGGDNGGVDKIGHDHLHPHFAHAQREAHAAHGRGVKRAPSAVVGNASDHAAGASAHPDWPGSWIGSATVGLPCACYYVPSFSPPSPLFIFYLRATVL